MQLYVVRSKKDKSGNKEKVRYYGVPLTSGKITEEELAEEISEQCSLTPTDVLATIRALSHNIQSHLSDGRTVSLKGIGTFYVSASSEGFDDPEECTPAQVKARRICFRADRTLRSILATMKYKLSKRGKK